MLWTVDDPGLKYTQYEYEWAEWSQLTQDSTEVAATQTAINSTAADHTASNQSVADRASGQCPPHGLVLGHNHIKVLWYLNHVVCSKIFHLI